jgi:hypothetical protein
MPFFDESRDQIGEAALPGGLARLVITVNRALFGPTAAVDGPPLAPRRNLDAVGTVDDDMGWLSLTSDADGHSAYEEDVTCMGVTPDDLDVHDADGGDLSWIGLSPVHAASRNGKR